MDIVELIKEFIKPELLIVAVVLYFVGKGLKKSSLIKDNYIPVILGIIGIIIAGIYVLATSNIAGYKAILLAIFTSITQGVVVAGSSVYIDQIIKQFNKTKEEKVEENKEEKKHE